MAMFVNTNVAGLNGQRNLQMVSDRMNSSFEKLSSGSRINSARDDSAGLQISDRLTSQITGLSQANRNANDGISIAQIAEGALSEITTNVQRMRQLAMQGGNRTLSTDDRSALGQEFEKLLNVNNNIAERTAFGDIKLLNSASPESGFQIQSGAFSGQQDTITTGNAELTALFGAIAKDDAANNALIISAMDETNIHNFGTLGKLVGAYMLATGMSAVSDANNAFLGSPSFGTNNGNSLVTVADFGTDTGGTFAIDTAQLTKIISMEADAIPSGGAANASAIADGLKNLVTIDATPANIDSVAGFSDANLNAIHAFTTDTLLDAMSALVSQVDKQRAKLGAEQNGLSSTIRSNSAAIVNVSDSRARIMDTDFATETAELTRNQIIQQAATTILSQANQLPQAALSLLR